MDKNKRFCLTLDLKDDPAPIREYRFWHQPEHIWPEIPEGIRKIGIIDMEIYLLENRFFMIIETVQEFDWEKDMAMLAELPRTNASHPPDRKRSHTGGSANICEKGI